MKLKGKDIKKVGTQKGIIINYNFNRNDKSQQTALTWSIMAEKYGGQPK